MARDDWNDSWYDDGDFPPARRRKAGGGNLVTARIVTVISCVLNALASSCLTFCGSMLSTVIAPKANNVRELAENLVIAFLVTGLGSGLAFVLQIVAAIGLFNNRAWSRTLSFWIAGLAIVMAMILGYHFVVGLMGDLSDDDMIAMVPLGIGLAAQLFYACIIIPTLAPRSVAQSLS